MRFSSWYHFKKRLKVKGHKGGRKRTSCLNDHEIRLKLELVWEANSEKRGNQLVHLSNTPRHEMRLAYIAKRARMREERSKGDRGRFPTHALSISRNVHASNTRVDV